MALEVGPQGLSAEQARARLARIGTNRIESHGGPSSLALMTRQFRSPLIYSLLIAAAVAAAFGETEDAVVVLAVVLLNALIGFGQEFRAARAIAALAEMVAEPARVQRDGRWRELPAEEIVPGDLIRVAQGDRVAADARLVRAAGLRTSEAALTASRCHPRRASTPSPSPRRWPNAPACCTPERSSPPARGTPWSSQPVTRASSVASRR